MDTWAASMGPLVFGVCPYSEKKHTHTTFGKYFVAIKIRRE
jgi:hypothetical protein